MKYKKIALACFTIFPTALSALHDYTEGIINPLDSYSYSSTHPHIIQGTYDTAPISRLEPRRRRLKAKGGGAGGARPDQEDGDGTGTTTTRTNAVAAHTKYAKTYGIANLKRSYDYGGEEYQYDSFLSQCESEDKSCQEAAKSFKVISTIVCIVLINLICCYCGGCGICKACKDKCFA